MRRTLPCLPLPAGTGIAPVAVAHRPLEHPLDPLGQAQLEQIGLAAALRLAHHTLIAPIPIAAQQPGRTFGPEPIQQRPQPGSRVLRRVPVAGLNLDLQHQPQIGQHVAVVGVRRPPRLLRIVANHRALLMAVEQLHRGVDIEDPRLAQQRPGAILELLLQPPPPRFRRNLAQCPTDRVLAHHLRHPEQWRIDRVAAQRRDVGVAPMPGQYRQHHRPQDVPLRRRVRARQRQRAPRYPAVEQPALLQILNRYSMKNGSWPSGVTAAPSPASHSM